MAGTACLYANWRVSTGKWGGIIKLFSAWTHYCRDFQKERGLWTKKYVVVLLRFGVNLNGVSTMSLCGGKVCTF